MTEFLRFKDTISINAEALVIDDIHGQRSGSRVIHALIIGIRDVEITRIHRQFAMPSDRNLPDKDAVRAPIRLCPSHPRAIDKPKISCANQMRLSRP